MTNKVPGISDQELIKMQFDYAWKWFDFHAKQRTTMFNFFVIFAGFIFASIAQLYRAQVPNMLLATAISGTGALVSFMFLGLDYRNSTLIEIGELYLRYLESNFFDKTKQQYFKINPQYKGVTPNRIGIFNIKTFVDQYTNFPNQRLCARWLNSIAKHRKLIPGIVGVVTLVFIGGAIYFYRQIK